MWKQLTDAAAFLSTVGGRGAFLSQGTKLAVLFKDYFGHVCPKKTIDLLVSALKKEKEGSQLPTLTLCEWVDCGKSASQTRSGEVNMCFLTLQQEVFFLFLTLRTSLLYIPRKFSL